MDNVAQKFEERWEESAYSAGVPVREVQAEVRMIRQMLKQDAEFFIEFFLADSLDLPVPDFHKEIWGLLTDQSKERVLLAIPRDHAKTTLAKLVVIWYWLFTRHRFCAYLSNTAAIAKNACRDIVDFMVGNPNFNKTFGKIRIEKQSENEGLWIFHMPMAGGVTKRCILRGIGQGQQMRGINIDNARPDFGVIDDVEDNENTESKTQQEKLDRWIYGPFLKAFAKNKKLLWLGNMLTKTCLLARLSSEPRWNPVVFGCLVKDATTGSLVPLWDGRWTVESLQDDLQEYRDRGLLETWMCEMMNMPGHSENGFSLAHVNLHDGLAPDETQCTWITVDPAFGQSASNDESAVAVHALDKAGRPVTVCCEHGHWTEVTLFNRILELAYRWNAWCWGIEAVAAQRLFIPYFNLLLTSRGMEGAATIIGLMAGRGDPKASRIRAWAELMAAGEWAISRGMDDVTSQLLNYDPSKKDQVDDRIDSCAYGPMMMDDYLSLIQESALGRRASSSHSRAKIGTEIEDV